MSHAIETYAQWLADYYLLSTVLLALTLIAVALLKQPSQRLAVIKSMLFALVLLAILCAIPGWSVVHLLTAEQTNPIVDSSPAVSTAPEIASIRSPRIDIDPTSLNRANSAPPLPQGEGRGEGAFKWSDISWPITFAAIHLSGAACLLGWLVLGWFASARLRRTAKPAPPGLLALLHEVAGKNAPWTQRVQLLTHDRIEVAVALGIWRPAILLPKHWLHHLPLPVREGPGEGSKQNDLRTILAHEFAHVQNRDLHWLAVSRALLILLWPQPLYWFLRRRMRLDQESLADAAAAELTSRQQYAEQLVAWARNARPGPTLHLSSAVGLWERPSQLRQRIAILLNDRITILRNCSRRWRLAAALTSVAAAITLSMVTLQPQTRAEDRAQKEKSDSVTKPSNSSAAIVDPSIWRWESNTAVGRAVDENIQPIVGAEVYLFRVNQHDGTRKLLGKKSTDANGRFRFDNVIDIDKEFPGRKFPGSYEVGNEMLEGAIRVPGRVTTTWLIMLQEVAKHGDCHESKMLPAATLHGRVTDTHGKPIANALVSIGRGVAIWEGAQTARTDADGYYTIEDAAPFDEAKFKQQQKREQVEHRFEAFGLFFRRPVLTVEHPDYAVKQTTFEKSPGIKNVQLGPAAVLEGRVVFADSGKPAPGVLVGLVTAVEIALGSS